MNDPRIGIDLGGTKIEGVVVSGSGDDLEILEKKRRPTESEKGFEHVTNRTVGLIEELAKSCGLKPPYRVGMGMPGSVTGDGRIKNCNAVCLNHTHFHQELKTRLGQDMVFANDADCFALAEAVLGAGKGHALVFGVIMGTGVGGGIVHRGVPRKGPLYTSGEWGHMVLDPKSDRSCYCGQKGCVETYLAGPWLENRFYELTNRKESLIDIVKSVEAREDNALRFASEWMDHFGLALSNVLNVLDPDVVVLGGGVSNADFLYTLGREKVADYVFCDQLHTPIVKNELGDSAGVLGAALLV